MTKHLLFVSLLAGLCAWGSPTAGRAQASGRRGTTYWYSIQNDAVVQKTGATAKPLKDDVRLPNGSVLKPLDRLVVTASGEEVSLGNDDMVTASGEIIRVKAPAAPTGPAPAPTPVVAKVAPAKAAPAAASPAKFAYVPPAPVGGKLKGVVELGASGFNSFVVRIDPQRNWKLEKAEFGNSLVLENMATDDDIRRGLKAYIGKMLDYGVGGRDIYFVVSSGAATAEGTKHIIDSLKALGYVVHLVTPEQEGTYGLKAAVPPAYADKAFMVDMGSANTKIAWQAAGKTTVASTYGSKYYQQALPDSRVAADVADKAAQVPTARRATCFIIGGVPYELAKTVRQGQEPFTVLKAPADYAQAEGAKLKAGVTIYKALAESTGCQQFVFGWDTNFTIGYLLAQP
ncbi:MAG TPA: hypothetical protein VFO93_13015 [Hymenobacter sp.]|uniref:hypothetical protein n=1 Tax=Hymenobacter sp. TaxID=1898978 RepID=UPI002D7EF5A9|nr:hypothetical protein [Hymenobacter sp.]HET9504455.1 hypothetical protein [Hymenobacter sp.]